VIARNADRSRSTMSVRQMVVDGLTKLLAGSSFESSVSLLGLRRVGRRESENIAEIRIQREY
jgi:hypothetical protein